MDRPASDQREPPTASVITTTEPDLTGDNQVRERSVDGILRLRGASDMRMQRRRVTWTEEVVDNEGLGKKKTKICCIYAKPRKFGESSSEDSDSSSSSEDDEHRAAGPGHASEREPVPQHVCQTHQRKKQRRKNAYERQPKPTK